MSATSETQAVAIVLPPRECFTPDGAGAIALLTERLGRAASRYPRRVIGSPCAHPFPGIDFRPVPRPALPIPRLLAYARGAARLAHGAALIEVHNQPRLAVALAWRCPTAAVALFLHNDPLAMRGLRRPAERARAQHRLAAFVCVSPFLADRLRAAMPTAPCSILPNCIDLARLPPHPARRDPIILFAGRLTADKGADSFVAACALALPRLPGWRAEMIGADRFSALSPPTPFTRALAVQAAAAPVHLLGFRPHAGVLHAMARAAIVVIPSRWQEPFGLTALEAMASGATLVCSTRGGLAALTAGAAYPCDPDDPNSIAAAILQAAAAPRPSAVHAIPYALPAAAQALDAWRAAVLEGRP